MYTILKKKSDKLNSQTSFLLFLGCCFVVFLKLYSSGNMIDLSYDATNIWQTIKSWYGNEEIFNSYVLYKGFSSIFPYVWLYKIAVFLGVNDFFFIMLYHSLLFSFITIVGVPFLVKESVGSNVNKLQIVLFSILMYKFWESTKALSQLMIDLPSCACYIATCMCLVKVTKSDEVKLLYIILFAFFDGMISNMSGQYILSAYILLVAVLFYILNIRIKNLKYKFALILTILVCFYSISFLNVLFFNYLRTRNIILGVNLSPASAWMERGLIYMMNMNRFTDLHSNRGDALISSLFGADEGIKLWQKSMGGTFGLTITEYVNCFTKHPIDFCLTYVDKIFLCLSIDPEKNNSFHYLAFSYTLVFITFSYFIKSVKRFSDFFSLKIVLLFSSFASVIPVAVLTVELRYALSLQSIVFGIAILGPFSINCFNFLRKFFVEKKILTIKYPFVIIIWGIYLFISLAYYNSFYCINSVDPARCLFHW